MLNYRVLLILSLFSTIILSGCSNSKETTTNSVSNSEKENTVQKKIEQPKLPSINPKEYITSPIGKENIDDYLKDITLYEIYNYANPQQLYSTYTGSDENIFNLSKNDYSSYEGKDKFNQVFPDIQKHAKFGEKGRKLIVPILGEDQVPTSDDNEVIGIRPGPTERVILHHDDLSSKLFTLDKPDSKDPKDEFGRNYDFSYAGSYQLSNITKAFFFVDGIRVKNEQESRALEKLNLGDGIGLRGNLYLEFPQADGSDNLMPILIKECKSVCRRIAYKFNGADLEFYDLNTKKAITNKVRVYPTPKMEENPPFNFLAQ